MEKYLNFSKFTEFARSIKSSFLVVAQQHKTTILLTILLLGLILADQVIKYAFVKWLSFTEGVKTPGFSFQGAFNEGLILNLQLKGLDIAFGALIFTLLLITLLFFYVAGLRWLSQSFHIIKIGLTFLCGGAFSNLLDKIRHGQVLDFIKFQPGENSISFFFNTADIFQTIGWIILIYGVIKLRKQIWRTVERREKFLIYDMQIQKYQIEFISYILWIIICIGLSIFLISHKLTEFSNSLQPKEQAYLFSSFINYYFIIYVTFALLVMGMTVYFSNKIYGPMYSIQKYIKAILKGEEPGDLKMRKGDQFREMEELMVQLKDQINPKTKQIKEDTPPE